MTTRVQNKRTHTHACLKHDLKEGVIADVGTRNNKTTPKQAKRAAT
jgi:hypothetical protein